VLDIIDVDEINTTDEVVNDIEVGIDIIEVVMVLVVVTWSSFVGSERVSVELLIVFPSGVVANEPFSLNSLKAQRSVHLLN